MKEFKIRFRVKYLKEGAYVIEEPTTTILSAENKQQAARFAVRLYRDQTDVACVHIDKVLEVDNSVLQ